MRFTILCLLALFATVFALLPPQKPVVVSFPDDTPSSVINDAIEEVKKGGGIITHEYGMNQMAPSPCWQNCRLTNPLDLIKGFAAKVSEATLEKITALTEEFIPYIEDDFVVRIDGSSSNAGQ